MRRKSPNKSDDVGNTLEDGFFKTLLDNIQIGVIVSNAEGIIILARRGARPG